MQTSICQDKLVDYVQAQLNAFFPDGYSVNRDVLVRGSSDALLRLEQCFLKVRVKKYFDGGHALFDHLYSDQYLMFLWFLSNSLWRKGVDQNTLNKVYLLNKCLHGFDCAYDTALPNVFIVIHGVGTVLGKAQYLDYFTVYQGCTVGQTQGRYPRLGRGVGLGAGASIIGDCLMGDFASIGAGCTLVNFHVENNSSIFRDPTGALVVREGAPATIARQYFLEDHLFKQEA
jgi:serine O-acetyltransferase